MHVFIAGLYACVVYLALLSYIVIIDGPLLKFLAWSPVIISGAMVALTVLDSAVRGASWAYARWRAAAGN